MSNSEVRSLTVLLVSDSIVVRQPGWLPRPLRLDSYLRVDGKVAHPAGASQIQADLFPTFALHLLPLRYPRCRSLLRQSALSPRRTSSPSSYAGASCHVACRSRLWLPFFLCEAKVSYDHTVLPLSRLVSHPHPRLSYLFALLSFSKYFILLEHGCYDWCEVIKALRPVSQERA